MYFIILQDFSFDSQIIQDICVKAPMFYDRNVLREYVNARVVSLVLDWSP
jgi:hypothetical protein